MIVRLIWRKERNPHLDPSITCHMTNFQHFENTSMKILRKGSFNIPNFNWCSNLICREKWWISMHVCQLPWTKSLHHKKNQYLLHLISGLLDQFSHAKMYTKIDLRGTYNLVRNQEGDEWKMPFQTCYNHFEYVVMAFGLTNAPSVFQHMMNDVFHEYLDYFVVGYIDDIFIFSKNMVDHEHHVHLALEKFKKLVFYAKLEKCGFHQLEVEFLGYIIFGDDSLIDPHKVQTIVDWATPISVRDVQCFLGFVNFYQWFIAHYSMIMIPLTRLTWKDQPFSWGVETKNVFQFLKASFTTISFFLPMQTLPNLLFLRRIPLILHYSSYFHKLEKIIFFI